MNYIKKMRGISKSPPRVNLAEMLWSWVGAFLGIASVAFIHSHLLEGTDLVFIMVF